MENQIPQAVKSKSFISAVSLFLNSGYAAALGLIANLALTILLSPQIFGIYITMLSLISFLNYFSDFGLAASLIQKKEISDDDVKTTFTTQQILIIILITFGFLMTPVIKGFYNLPVAGMYLYWALLFSFFISSLKTIPSIFLERKIQFQKIVMVQIVESTVFYVSVILLAVKGYGLYSFTFSVLLRAIVGLVLIYKLSPWMPRIGITKQNLKTLLSFGIPFQSSAFLALFKDDFIILFLGKALGFEGVGYIGWAKKWAESPLRIVMDNVSRVTFPLIARFQGERDKVSKLLQKILFYQTAILAPVMAGSLLLMPYVVQILPKYQKWAVALPLFFIFVISSFLVSYMSPFINLFNALGKVKYSFGFMFVWTVITWILTPILTHRFGYYGFPITHLTVSLTFMFVVMKAKKFADFDITRLIGPFMFSTFFMLVTAGSAGFLLHLAPIAEALIVSIIAAATYILSLQYVFKMNLRHEVGSFLALRHQS